MDGFLAAAASAVLAFTAPTSGIIPPTCTLSAPPGTYYAGDTVRLIWYTEHADNASISELGPIPVSQVPQGFRDIALSQSTLYTMTVANSAGTRTCAALVTIAPYQAAPTYSPSYYQSSQPLSFSPTQIRYINNTPLTYPVILPWNVSNNANPYNYSYDYSNDYSYDNAYDRYWYDPWMPDHYTNGSYDTGYSEGPYTFTDIFNGSFSGDFLPSSSDNYVNNDDYYYESGGYENNYDTGGYYGGYDAGNYGYDAGGYYDYGGYDSAVPETQSWSPYDDSSDGSWQME